MKKFLLKSMTLLVAIGFIANVHAEISLLDVQHRWAKINYEMEDDAQIDAFKALIADIEAHLATNSEDADLLIWRGISKSTLAGAEGGLGALSIAEEAKESLEQAMAINDKALDGSAYTSLATLYHNVPGWPLGFGSDKKAKELFKKAIEINPKGIDPNYFYAEFFYNERKYKSALKYLERAQSAESRPDRPLADAGRRQEIERLLSKVNKKLRR
ncbi:MAG: hypothetical protein KJO69_07390 [Gammaproteobacteria bacterium]|nr:hypothetical protein [Gammaproteobacteria bacterium]